MGRPRIVEVNYYEFKKHLKDAGNVGERIEKGDKEQWAAYVRDNKVNEVAMMHWGKSRYEGCVPVIITQEGEWAGFYVYSSTDEAVLKWERSDD